MTDPIRQQIIEAVESKVAEIRISKGYKTDMGKNIRSYMRYQENLPFISIWPGLEEANREYGNVVASMPIKVEGVVSLGGGDRVELFEQILADIIENIVGVKWVLDFTSGGTHRPSAGDAVVGATNGAEAILESVSLDSGAWADGDAAGSFTLRRKSGTFIAENLDIGGESNVATTDGTISSQSAEYTTTNDLADDIIYISGGLEEFPEGYENVVGMSANFQINYPIIHGNPYQQP